MADSYTTYTSGFYETQRDGSLLSARRIVPEVLRLAGNCRSVVDVGCGVGTWLKVFQENGITDYLGIDGEYVERQMLEIPADHFLAHDLREPLKIDRTFDIVVSLEVAEHLPPSSAETFVNTLTSLGPVVLFSAAVPFQNGNNHINEQWPDYWAGQFAKRGFVAVDAVRKAVWSDTNVEPWYAQNTIVYVKEDRLADFPRLAEIRACMPSGFLSIIHPKTYLLVREEAQLSVTVSNRLDNIPLKRILTALPHRVVRSLKERLWRGTNGQDRHALQ
jgi:SAM-dependent methyltransferase